jgi:endonuclease/exonuclease/phosphatase (EEP) superfamily protein YafD
MRHHDRHLEVGLGAAAAWLASGTLLSLTRSPHWYARGWDFPRLLVFMLAAGTGGWWRWRLWRDRPGDYVVVGGMAAVAAWQLKKIARFTPLARPSVKRARRAAPEKRLRLVVSNVLQGNEEYGRWARVVLGEDPDVILVLEADDGWARRLESLHARYPHRVELPQDNFYGMLLLSRLPLHRTAVRHLVEDDIPSVHTQVELRSGERVWLHAVHPRPPEPLRNQGSEPRDAELVLLAREIEKAPDEPRLVAGDLNDVAWSETSRLFLKLSGMLDPRQGRGLFATFNANYPHPLRWPLDHVFHSGHFRLVELRKLDHVGSDHFPVLIDLACEPQAAAEQSTEGPSASDEEEADEVLERQPPRERPKVS